MFETGKIVRLKNGRVPMMVVGHCEGVDGIPSKTEVNLRWEELGCIRTCTLPIICFDEISEDENSVRDLIIEDLYRLTSEELTKVYKFIQRKIITPLDGSVTEDSKEDIVLVKPYINKICNYIVNEISLDFFDDPDGGYRYTCPLCGTTEEIKVKDESPTIRTFGHDSDCPYLTSKFILDLIV